MNKTDESKSCNTFSSYDSNLKSRHNNNINMLVVKYIKQSTHLTSQKKNSILNVFM